MGRRIYLRGILTNDYESSTRDIVEFYNLRGGQNMICLLPPLTLTLDEADIFLSAMGRR